MKKTLLTSVVFLSAAAFTNAQDLYPIPAEDFTVTDLQGGTHSLFSILESGKVVVLDVSATWCSPCWGFHQSGYLEDLNEQLGPDGTDQIRVIWYEGDASTGQADLEGSGTSQGDWITGTTYPLINESPIQLDFDIYNPIGFPTINVISPLDNEVKEDILFFNTGTEAENLQEMIDFILQFATAVGVNENLKTVAEQVSLYPSPASNFVDVNFSQLSEPVSSLIITNAIGQIIKTIAVNESLKTQFVVGDLENGIYFMNIQNNSKVIGVKKFTVQK
jgi:thiol-disulfide isomerase/thioredoxin